MGAPARSVECGYLVRGDDPALLADALRNLVAAVLAGEDPALAVEEFVIEAGDDQRVAAVLDACLTPPFLSARRVVVVRNAGALVAEEGARLAGYLEHPLDSTVLVLVAGGGTVPAKLVAAVKKAGEVVDAGLPRQGRQRTGWLVERLKDAPVDLDAAAATLLGQHLGEDMGRLSGLLETLAGAYGPGARIGTAELEPFLGEAGGVAPWDLTDALDRGDYEGALTTLRRLLHAGDRHPLVVMATLHRHYAAMLRLDGAGARTDGEAAALLGIKGSPYPAKKALVQSRRLGSVGVRRAIRLLAEADLDLRGAKAWPEELVMEVLVARLCQLARG
ncbi:MAG: DNA polymerase III subunit delta [Actinobacteria bacterium]|nr:DNA polymerase III subunit delta [Actinomycetota bacterium]MBW3649302.1 DNA polymerase III subunit delta [Actinomycetota bacterium]